MRGGRRNMELLTRCAQLFVFSLKRWSCLCRYWKASSILYYFDRRSKNQYKCYHILPNLILERSSTSLHATWVEENLLRAKVAAYVPTHTNISTSDDRNPLMSSLEPLPFRFNMFSTTFVSDCVKKCRDSNISRTAISVVVVSRPQNAVQSFAINPADITSLPLLIVPATRGTYKRRFRTKFTCTAHFKPAQEMTVRPGLQDLFQDAPRLRCSWIYNNSQPAYYRR